MPKPAAERARELLELADGLFRANGRTVDEITELLGIDREGLNSALETISLCGLPPYDPYNLIEAYIDDERVYISHVPGTFDRPARLTRDEALALFLAGRAAASADPAHEPALESALDKIRDALKPEDASTVGRASAQFDIAPHSENVLPVLNVLKKCCAREKVSIEYYSAGRDDFSARTIRPCGLIYHIDQWYCVAWCELRAGIRLFRVDRVKSAAATGENFSPPADFDLGEFRREKMFRMIPRPHKVVLRFSPDMAPVALEKWPDRAKKQRDGSVDISFRVDRLESFAPTILGYGPSVSVISPPELREMIRKTADKTLCFYR